MKSDVFVTREIPEEGILLLRDHVNLEMYEGRDPISRAELLERVRDKDGILSMLTDTIDEKVMSVSSRLRVISNYAVGYNNIDLEAATRRGILVTNTPGVLTHATADLTWALLLSVARRIPEGDRFMRDGKFTGWAPTLLLGTELLGKTFGIVGLGRIGQEVARRAFGFNMRCIYHDINQADAGLERELNIAYADMDTLFSESDFISLHLPLTDQNLHLIGDRLLKRMKSTAYLINTSRGEVIDEKALIGCLRARKIAGAALDVFEGEPSINNELIGIDNLVLVPHVGSATVETRNKMARMAVENLVDALENRKPKMLVNLEVWEKRNLSKDDKGTSHHGGNNVCG